MQRVREQDGHEANGKHADALDDLRAVLSSREPLYARAYAKVDTSDVPVATMVERLVDTITARFGEGSATPQRRLYA